MGLLDAISTATSGVQAQVNAINNISTNLANSSTDGYKTEDTIFSDLVSDYSSTSNSSGTSGSPSGYSPGGVSTYTTQLNTVSGTIAPTSYTTNMAISGNGFFAVSSDAAGTTTSYTRNGSFTTNVNGNLVNSAGYYLQGWPLDSNGNATQALQTITIPETDAAAGTLTSTTVTSSGIVQATYSDGTTNSLYQVPLANFTNPDSLQSLSGEAYQPSASSGTATYSVAGTSGTGTIVPESIENSNVDVATQLSNMIIAQNSYSFNSQLISTSSSMLETAEEMLV